VRLGGDSIVLAGPHVTGTFNTGPAGAGAPASTTGQITRTDGKSWSDANFLQGQQVAWGGTMPAPGQVGSVAINNPTILTVTGMSGSTLYVSGTVLTSQMGVPATVTVLPTGIGPSSPLVVYGDTSQDGTWYNGKSYQSSSLGIFGNKPMPHEDNLAVTLATPGAQLQAAPIAQLGTFTNTVGTFGTIKRTDGNSWITAGFLVDGLVTIDGTAVGEVQTLTADTLTLTGLTPAFSTFTSGISHTIKQWNTGTITRSDGNSWLTSGFVVEGIITIGSPVSGLTFARALTGDTITRADGGSWVTAGFIAGQTITVRGTPGNDGKYLIKRVSATTLTLTVTNTLTAEGPETATISADVGTVSQITASTLTFFDLQPFFLTSLSGIHTVVQRNRLGENTDFFVFPLASSYTYAGNNFIDGHLLDAGVPNGQLPSVGFTAYGGPGNDTILGSQAGDFLAGGSGNNVIEGNRGQDQIFGAAGFNVNVMRSQECCGWPDLKQSNRNYCPRRAGRSCRPSGVRCVRPLPRLPRCAWLHRQNYPIGRSRATSPRPRLDLW
jgi:RTX calcium-binding nonapeptide repeat (4 copies)